METVNLAVNLYGIYYQNYCMHDNIVLHGEALEKYDVTYDVFTLKILLQVTYYSYASYSTVIKCTEIFEHSVLPVGLKNILFTVLQVRNLCNRQTRELCSTLFTDTIHLLVNGYT